MSPRATTPKSNFFGPWHRLFQTPLAGSVTVQFHNLQPGTEWTPVDGIRAGQPFLLTPDGPNPRWIHRSTNFRIDFNQRFDRLHLIASHQPDNTQIFLIITPFALFTPGYNLRQDGTGLFAFGGTCTVQWRQLPL